MAQIPLFDNKATGSASTTTITVSFLVGNNANRLLVVRLHGNRTAPPSSVTYNGVAMTVIDNTSGPGLNLDQHSSWYLVAPATGANNLVITQPNANTCYYSIHSYYNAAQAGQPHQHAIAMNDGGAFGLTATASITTTINNCLIYGFAYAPGTAPAAPTGIPNNQTSTGLSTIAGDNGGLTPAGAASVAQVAPADGYSMASVIAFIGAPSAETSTILETSTLTETITIKIGRFFTKLDTITGTDIFTSIIGRVLTILDTVTGTEIFTGILNSGWINRTKNSGSLTNRTKH